MAKCSSSFSLLLLVVQAVVGVTLLPPADLLVVAYFATCVTLTLECLTLLFPDFSGCPGSVSSLSTPATLFMTGGF